MENMRTLGLLDSNGKPLAERIQRVLTGLLPKVRRQFPTLRDDLALAEHEQQATDHDGDEREGSREWSSEGLLEIAGSALPR